MAYTNFTNCTANEYKNIIYNQETKNKIRILFNNVELEDADEYCELFEVQSRVIPYGSKVFMLENLVSQEATLILHNIDTSIIQDQVSISIGTLVDSQNDIYEYVPIGIYNLQEIPTTDKGKTTILLRDNSVKLDFYYNAQPLIELNGGNATKLQILQDICYQAGITCNVLSFLGDSDEIGVYDNTIKGRQYVSWLAGSAGAIPIITRNGALDFKYINNLSTIEIPIEKVEGFTNAENFKISKVIYESGIIKYEQGNETNDTLFLDSANPYVLSQEQVEDIYDIVNGFEINSFTTQRILGNPSIDAYDLIQITDYDETVYKCFANNILRYTGKLLNTFDSEISFERKKENVTKNSSETFRKWAKTEIDSANAKILIQAGEIGDRTNKQTSLTQDVDGLNSTVQNIPPMTTDTQGIGQVTLNNLSSVKLSEFKVHPTNQDILGLLVSPNTIVSSTLKVRSRGITFDGPVKAHFKIPKLYCYNSVYDEFIYNATDELAYVIRRVAIDNLGNKSILQEPYEEQYEYRDIQLEEGNYNIYVPGYPTAYIYAKGIVKNPYTTSYATSYELETKVEQTENRFNVIVREKVDKSEVIADLNVAIENHQGIIRAIGNVFEVDSDNFKVSPEGNMECNNAKINGNLVTANGVLTNLTFVDEIWSWYNENGYDNTGIGYVGFNSDAYMQNVVKSFMVFDIKLPNDFAVSSAKIHLKHWPTKWWNSNQTASRNGSCQNMQPCIMQVENSVINAQYLSDYGLDLGSYTFTQISGIPQFSFSDSIYQEKSIEIPLSIFENNQNLKIAIITSVATPSWPGVDNLYSALGPYTGVMSGITEITGYMKYNPNQQRTIQIGEQEEPQRVLQESENEPLNIGQPNEEEESDR